MSKETAYATCTGGPLIPDKGLEGKEGVTSISPKAMRENDVIDFGESKSYKILIKPNGTMVRVVDGKEIGEVSEEIRNRLKKNIKRRGQER